MSNHAHISGFRAVALALTAVALMVWTPSAQGQLGLGLAPMRVELRMTPGQQYSGTLSLDTDAGSTMRIRGELDDFFIDETTTPQFVANAPSESRQSCKSWLSLNPMEIEAKAKDHVAVRYTVRVPADATEGSYHCAAGFVTLPTAGEPTFGLRTAVRVVSAFYVVIGNPQLSGGLKRILLEPAAKDDPHHWRAVVVMENTGNLHYRPTGNVTVSDATGKVLEQIPLPSLAVLPQRDQRLVIPLTTDLSNGSYKLQARVEIGNGEIQAGSIAVGPSAPAH